MSFIGNAPANKLISSSDIANGTVSANNTSFIVGNGSVYINSKTISEDVTINSGNNALSAGAVTIGSNVTVSIVDGTWTIV